MVLQFLLFTQINRPSAEVFIGLWLTLWSKIALKNISCALLTNLCLPVFRACFHFTFLWYADFWHPHSGPPAASSIWLSAMKDSIFSLTHSPMPVGMREERMNRRLGRTPQRLWNLHMTSELAANQQVGHMTIFSVATAGRHTTTNSISP